MSDSRLLRKLELSLQGKDARIRDLEREISSLKSRLQDITIKLEREKAQKNKLEKS